MRSKVLVFVALCFVSIAYASTESVDASDIGALVERIKVEPSGIRRTELAADLTAIARRARGSDQIDDMMIDSIASLLSDRDDSVRLWAALALGQFGPRASSEIPALERALRDVEAAESNQIKRPSLSSADAIRTALERIRTPPLQ